MGCRWGARVEREVWKEEEEGRVERGSRDSGEEVVSIVMRRAKDVGEVEKDWKAVWSEVETEMPDCMVVDGRWVGMGYCIELFASLQWRLLRASQLGGRAWA